MLQVKNVKKKYQTGDLIQQALDGVSVNFRDNEFVAILGPSGSGKTTLLNVIGGLDRYDEGELIINSHTTKKYKDSDWDYYRNHTIGFVFQSYNLIPHQSVLANVELALTIAGVSKAERRQRALDALDKVGLKEHAHKKPNQMSGGQMQRVAIARALVNNPDIVLADEPTGALDSETSVQVMDLLKEVAKDRLVVMVTHNPELAKQYATRIVTIKDGKIISDSDPYIVDDSTQPAVVSKKGGKSSMSFLTALSLSLNNLLTKKTRTILVAAAGSIGIIGIALIMSLSTGVNEYINDTEEEAMSEYPLQITSVGYDLTSILTSVQGSVTAEASDSIGVADTISAMFNSMSENDLSSLKEYLDSGESNIEDYAQSVEYIYDVSPEVYTDYNSTYYNVSASMTASSSSSSSSSSMFSTSTGSFYQLPENADLYEDKYDVKAGRWPENENEAVLVLSYNGQISDTMLYTFGIKDYSDLQAMFTALAQGTTYEIVTDSTTYSYDDFLGHEFKYVAKADYYTYDESIGVWTSHEDNSDYISSLMENAETLTVVGIVMPNEETDVATLSTGIAYTYDLTESLMTYAAESDVVKAQLAEKTTNIFTGEAFTESSSSFSLENLITVDSDALTNAFSFDTSGLSLDTSSLNLSGIDFSSAIDASALQSAMPSFTEADISAVMSQVNITLDSDTLQTLLTDLYNGYINENQEVIDQYTAGITAYFSSDTAVQLLKTELSQMFSDVIGDSGVLSQERITSMVSAIYESYTVSHPESDITFEEYLASQEGQAAVNDQLNSLISDLQKTSISAEDITALAASLSSSYNTWASENNYTSNDALTASFLTYISSESAQNIMFTAVSEIVDTDSLVNAFAGVMNDKMASFSTTLSNEISAGVSSAMTQVVSQLTSAMTSSFANLSSLFTVDAESIQNAFQFNMSTSDLQDLMSSMLSGDSDSYESNLTELGYTDFDSPSEIDIYPANFEAKSEITNILDAYNLEMQESGQDDKVITYTDLVATMLSSVTDIVNTISYVLIAFVAISLVVSSIMIGVITYISVLERRKEIGILRALGASKHNITQVFNAETFITGLLAGAIGVISAEALTIPINYIIHAVTDSNDINAVLPVTAIGGLIILSILLTLIAGLLPSKKAAKSDPVTALRSE